MRVASPETPMTQDWFGCQHQSLCSYSSQTTPIGPWAPASPSDPHFFLKLVSPSLFPQRPLCFRLCHRLPGIWLSCFLRTMTVFFPPQMNLLAFLPPVFSLSNLSCLQLPDWPSKNICYLSNVLLKTFGDPH